ncbi:E3 ubiquitin-protein ligase [Sesamum alatum]|uniref:E3 ubiquitin-protein ligase RMA n=1 Tax=Sesamum alatum TaxID=300844 RepID=A0AAE1XKD4_9LAMI|nr:E3 ubiquitin-protein ligase [Sesamum alatum]
MAGENPGAVNLDLNVGPLDNASDGAEPGSGTYTNVLMNLGEWLPVPRARGVVRYRSRRASLARQLPVRPETRNLALELVGEMEVQTGEGSVTAEESRIELTKVLENGNIDVENEAVDKKNDEGKNNREGNSFFDCNICLDLARDPVVTCCGHLFCWPCLYRWLHHHSDAKECPICKGEVTVKNVTPIYGRGNVMREPNVDCSLMKIPIRPQARRVERCRRTLGISPGVGRAESWGRTHDADGVIEIMGSFVSRWNRQQIPEVQYHDAFGLTETSPPNYEARDNGQLSSRNSLVAAALSDLTSAVNSAGSPVAERLVESHFVGNQMARARPRSDDRDSISSIAGIIHSDSQTMDNTAEIDSIVARLDSYSRRRDDAARNSDVDSGDSDAPRRRRLN